jgi:hypothetical protein
MRRRTLLKGAVATGTLATAGTGLASAGGGNDDLDAPLDYPGVTTRDHFDITWYGSVERVEGTYEYDYRGD